MKQNTDSTADNPTRRQASFWVEMGCILSMGVTLLTVCLAASLMIWSAEVPYHHHYTAFHIIAIAVILFNGAFATLAVMLFPYSK